MTMDRGDDGWRMVEARPGWWLERRDLESGDVMREPVALWAWREDGEVRPVAVGEARDGVERLRPVDVRAPDIEGVAWAPEGSRRRADERERERRAWA
jgi:hypothetical protein